MSRAAEQFATYLRAHTGLDYPRPRLAELVQAWPRIAGDLGLSAAEDRLDRLLAQSPGQRQVEALARHLTVGETYFLRDCEVFAQIQQRLLPQRMQARQMQRRLRLWSAGCSSGEEAYSLAILRAQMPALADWDVSILGSDINPCVLARAAAAVYGEWSFRSTAPDWRQAYFQRTAEGLWRLRDELRRGVEFSYLNLVEPSYPSPLTQTQDLDLILCRNVLIYFAPEQAAQTLRRLAACLADGGYLLLAASEVPLVALPEFERLQGDGVTVFRKKSTTRQDPLPDRAATAQTEPLPPARLRRRQPPAPPCQPAPGRRPPAPSEPAAAASALDAVRALAASGELRAALAQCEAGLAQQRLDVSLHYLRAALLAELGQDAAAEEAFGRVLYLEPSLALAWFGLAELARRRGDGIAALRHYQRAADSARALPADAMLAQGDGLNAGRLVETIAILLGRERAAPPLRRQA